MGRFRTLRRTWTVRLAASVLFAAGAVALAQAAGEPSTGLVTQNTGTAGSSIERHAAKPLFDRAVMGANVVRTPEGATIVVSAGRWSPIRVHEMLMQNGLSPTLGAHLTVRVETAYPPTRIMWTEGIDAASGRAVRYPTLWLDAWPGSEFSRAPDRTVARAVGRLWIEAYVRPVAGSFWPGYLALRRVRGNPRLDRSRAWSRDEILADDYRLLFGSTAAIAQLPRPENPALADPRSIPGLRDLLTATALR
jgi:hypothetical protein